jgi:flagellar basal-body rod protein FlgG
MYTLLYTNRSAMTAQQNKIDAISNNIANVNTVGYKKINVQFQDLYNNSLERLGYPTSEGAENLYAGSGIKSTAALRQFSQGSFYETGFSTDIAIDGRGLFKMYKQDGTVGYTRNGNFKVDSAGVLVDNNGYKLSIVDNEGQELNYNGGPLKLTGDNFNVDKDGAFYIKRDAGFERVGQIKTYDSVGGNGLLSAGESLFVPMEGVTMEEVTDRNIQVGYLENSNVEIGQEMTDMILTQRAFQMNSTGLKTVDEMWQMINNLR